MIQALHSLSVLGKPYQPTGHKDKDKFQQSTSSEYSVSLLQDHAKLIINRLYHNVCDFLCHYLFDVIFPTKLQAVHKPDCLPIFLPNSTQCPGNACIYEIEENGEKKMNICESPQSSIYNEGLLPPNAFALSNRKKSCTKENFLNLSRFYILSRKFI